MVLPTVNEISHQRALELQREWQRAVADQAKPQPASDSESPDRR